MPSFRYFRRLRNIRYVTSVERICIEKGIQQGIQQGRQGGQSDLLLRLLTRRFGAVPEGVRQRIQTASVEIIETWFDRAMDANSLEDVFSETRH